MKALRLFLSATFLAVTIFVGIDWMTVPTEAEENLPRCTCTDPWGRDGLGYYPGRCDAQPCYRNGVIMEIAPAN